MTDDFKGPYLTDLVFYNSSQSWTNIGHVPTRIQQTVILSTIENCKGKNDAMLDGSVKWYSISSLVQTAAGTGSYDEWMLPDMW